MLKRIFWGTFFLCLLWGMDCQAWAPPKDENTSKFLVWYEENKNKDGAVYQLSGDMMIDQEEVVILNGDGKVTIDCGQHGIVVDSELILDNPNLEIRGEYFFLLMLRGDVPLTLSGGTLNNNCREGSAIQVNGGELRSPVSKGAFHIQVRGERVTGIAFNVAGEKMLANLSINVKGSVEAKGVELHMPSKLNVQNCDIEAKGRDTAYGIYAREDIIIKDSVISAVISEPNGICYGAYTDKGSIQCENSTIEPEGVVEENPIIVQQKQTRPVYVEVNESPGNWNMSESVEVFAKEGEKEKIITVPVTWDVNETAFKVPGYCIIEGKFETGISGQPVSNPKGIVPKITVLCLQDDQMFPIAYETSFSDSALSGVLMLIPYPFDADYLGVEYSLDGETYLLYNSEVDSNQISKEDTLPDTGMRQLIIRLPQDWQKVYVRFIVKGNSLFSGISDSWKLVRGEGTGIPEHIGDGSGGDRGGQEAEMPEMGVHQGTTNDSDTYGGAGTKRERVSSYSNGDSPDAIWGQASAENKKELNNDEEKVTDLEKEHVSKPKVVKNGKKQSEKKVDASRWPAVAGALIGVIVLGGLAVWCGQKVFKKKKV